MRFATLRGPYTPLHEFLSGANAFEIDVCVVDERGRPTMDVPPHQHFVDEPYRSVF